MRTVLEHSKACLFPVLFFAIAIMFASCGDDESSVSPSEDSSSSVALKSSSSKSSKKSSSSSKKSSSSVNAKSSDSKKSSSSKISQSSSSKTSSSSISSSSRNFQFVDPATVVTGTMTDSRDGKTYKTVTIGYQTWMAENLNYVTPGSFCYKDDDSYCDKYGRLYPMGNACPSGWHLPSSLEWDELIVAVGGDSIAGKMLKSTSGWFNGQNGTDAYGFSALPAGDGFCGYLGAFCKSIDGEGYLACFWQSSGCPEHGNHCYGTDRVLNYYFDNVIYSISVDGTENRVNSVRCVKDESTIKSSSSKKIESSSSVSLPSLNIVKGNMTDFRDNQIYKTVMIGSQIWMAENLNYETENSFCYKDSAKYCAKYGRLYTWAAAMDSAGEWSSNGKGCGYGSTCPSTGNVQGVCPSGWHLPSKAEYDTLISSIGEQPGRALKSTSGWSGIEYANGWFHDGNGTDDYSFSALPAGCRNKTGNFNREGYYAFFWGSTADCRSNPQSYCYKVYYVYMHSTSDKYVEGAYIDDFYGANDDRRFYYAFSVRCVKD